MSLKQHLPDPEIVRRIQRFQTKPPVDLVGLANELGLQVWERDLPDGISGEIRLDEEFGGSEGMSVFVRARDPLSRKRFTLAHEIAHYLLHRDLIGDGIEDSSLYRSKLSSRDERQANALAAEILMPSTLINTFLREGVKDSHEIASRLAVSEPALRKRFGMPA